jgi:hypothetical protein
MNRGRCKITGRFIREKDPRTMATSDNETYLGDGLYASFRNGMIWLRAPREGEDHIVALEPEVFQSLLEYAKGCFK